MLNLRKNAGNLVRNVMARCAEHRLDCMSPEQRIAFFNLGVTDLDEIVVLSCSHLTRDQLVAMADKVRKKDRILTRLRFGNTWVTLVEGEIIGSTHMEIILTGVASSGAKTVIHPSVCNALNPSLRCGDLCVLTDADCSEDPVCRFYGIETAAADGEMVDRLWNRLAAMGEDGFNRCHKVRSVTSPVFAKLTPEYLARLAAKGDVFDLEVATLYALAGRFGLKALSVKMVCGNWMTEENILTTRHIPLAMMLERGEKFLNAVVEALVLDR